MPLPAASVFFSRAAAGPSERLSLPENRMAERAPISLVAGCSPALLLPLSSLPKKKRTREIGRGTENKRGRGKDEGREEQEGEKRRERGGGFWGCWSQLPGSSPVTVVRLAGGAGESGGGGGEEKGERREEEGKGKKGGETGGVGRRRERGMVGEEEGEDEKGERREGRLEAFKKS
ncbi:hepatoma-derived growth factor-related protein 3-like [Solanum pennellii]|uniref:Hepatoma-derived growth factor-related protein 3-like n=1 Tax=Solanum pennellii TaxID=28526 RepID=A0ABM1FCL1_SOLPN|nr:hepatoma-derived growth factor-related protein 3-like [Solanum pennellii]